jgi:sulfatase maturation enzyme AslB (radical SAM superfamily)
MGELIFERHNNGNRLTWHGSEPVLNPSLFLNLTFQNSLAEKNDTLRRFELFFPLAG